MEIHITTASDDVTFTAESITFDGYALTADNKLIAELLEYGYPYDERTYHGLHYKGKLVYDLSIIDKGLTPSSKKNKGKKPYGNP